MSRMIEANRDSLSDAIIISITEYICNSYTLSNAYDNEYYMRNKERKPYNIRNIQNIRNIRIHTSSQNSYLLDLSTFFFLLPRYTTISDIIAWIRRQEIVHLRITSLAELPTLNIVKLLL